MLPPLPLFFFIDTAPPAVYTLSLHDALPISCSPRVPGYWEAGSSTPQRPCPGSVPQPQAPAHTALDRKSTRLNSSHRTISYAVFCLKKKIDILPGLKTGCASLIQTLDPDRV